MSQDMPPHSKNDANSLMKDDDIKHDLNTRLTTPPELEPIITSSDYLEEELNAEYQNRDIDANLCRKSGYKVKSVEARERWIIETIENLAYGEFELPEGFYKRFEKIKRQLERGKK